MSDINNEDRYDSDFVDQQLAKQKAEYESETQRVIKLIEAQKQQKIKVQTAAEIAKDEREKLKTETCTKCKIEKSCLPYQSFCDTCITLMSYNSYLDRYTDT